MGPETFYNNGMNRGVKIPLDAYFNAVKHTVVVRSTGKVGGHCYSVTTETICANIDHILLLEYDFGSDR